MEAVKLGALVGLMVGFLDGFLVFFFPRGFVRFLLDLVFIVFAVFLLLPGFNDNVGGLKSGRVIFGFSILALCSSIVYLL